MLDQLHSISHGHIHKQDIIELSEKVAEIDTDTILFIDEFDVLDNPECLNLFWWLYQYLPFNCHLVISSKG